MCFGSINGIDQYDLTSIEMAVSVVDSNDKVLAPSVLFNRHLVLCLAATSTLELRRSLCFRTATGPWTTGLNAASKSRS